MTALKVKIQNALDESRILLFGVQVLIGFSLRTPFQPAFERLSPALQHVKLTSLLAIVVTFALVIAPAPYHCVVATGHDTRGVHWYTMRVVELALLPFAAALGLEALVAGALVGGTRTAVIAGVVTCATALSFWYGIELAARRRAGHRRDEERTMGEASTATLDDRIKHVLTEARLILPGAQALLGFQLAAFLLDGFERLPPPLRWLHFASFGCVGLATILLVTPAAYHRIVERGESTESFHRFASRVLLTSLAPLGAGVCGDVLVVVAKVTRSIHAGALVAAFAAALFLALWAAVPLACARRSTARAARAIATTGASLPSTS